MNVNLLSIGTRFMSSDLTLCLCLALKSAARLIPLFAADAESMWLIQGSCCDSVLLM